MFRFEFVVLYTLYVPMVWSIFPTTNTHVGKWQNKGIGKNDWTIIIQKMGHTALYTETNEYIGYKELTTTTVLEDRYEKI